MKNNEKGSITLFVLLSMLFFLVVVVSVGAYLKNREIIVDQEYKKVQSSYGQEVTNEAEVYDSKIGERKYTDIE